MTAEIAIMNRSAIALAADSAVTVQTPDGPKIYNSANKLFRLSETQPVGIMLYGSASFFDVPWETIIKEYRNNMGPERHDTLEDYSENFLKFLQNNNGLFPESEQLKVFEKTLNSYYNFIKESIHKNVDKALQNKNPLTEQDIIKITSKTITAIYTTLKKLPSLPNVPDDHGESILRTYDKLIDKVVDQVFEKQPMYKKDRKVLKKIPGLYFSKDVFPGNISGVVVAGLGKKDIFPKLQSFIFETIFHGQLKYKKDNQYEINFETDSYISAFAQGEMVHTFMEGIDPGLKAVNEKYLGDIFKKFPDLIAGEIKGLPKEKKDIITSALQKVSESLYSDYHQRIEKYKQDNYIHPVISVVSILPKDELASMAESLVNLTMFKQKVSVGAETVGGPIDVAIISKGDGFVWIKRKFYFDRDLNLKYITSQLTKGVCDDDR